MSGKNFPTDPNPAALDSYSAPGAPHRAPLLQYSTPAVLRKGAAGTAPMEQSDLGIASLILSIGGGVIVLSGIVFSTLLTGRIMDAISLAMLGGALLCMIALGIGIVSLFQRQGHLFGVLAICLSAAIILLSVVAGLVAHA